MSDTKKGSIELARWLCEDIAGELEGEAYGSVDVAEILSAEVERLRERMTELEHQNAALKKENAALKAECIRVCELRFQATNEIYYITYNAGVRDCIAAIKDLGTSHE